MTPLLRSSDALSNKAIELLELLGDKGVQRVYTTLGRRAGILPHRPQPLRAAPRPRDGRPHARRRAAAARPAARGSLLRRHPGAHPGVHRRGGARAVQARRADRDASQRSRAVAVRDGADVRGDGHRRRSQPAGRWPRCAASRCATACRRCCTRSRSPASTAPASTATGRSPSPPTTRSSTASTCSSRARRRTRTSASSLFLAAVLKGVHRHAGLLRAGIASSGNEHRLGANEAPPAIISVFMGAMLTTMIESIAAGKTSANAAQAMIKLGVARAAGDREGQHGSQPHVAVRVHGQQVRVPRRGLVGVDRVPDRAAQRRRRRGARRDHRARSAPT